MLKYGAHKIENNIYTVNYLKKREEESGMLNFKETTFRSKPLQLF